MLVVARQRASVIGWLGEALTAAVPLGGWAVVDAFDVSSILAIRSSPSTRTNAMPLCKVIELSATTTAVAFEEMLTTKCH